MISSIFSSWDTCDEVDKKTVHTDLIVREYISLSVKLSVWHSILLSTLTGHCTEYSKVASFLEII